MGNETRKQFINSLDTGLKRQKKLLEVGIVDDMADKLEKEIKSEIECIVRTLSLEDFEKNHQNHLILMIYYLLMLHMIILVQIQ
ncbi:MAG: hypothetical protein E7310_05820 [Clostridiales bacterium]|nr:hypothetical protein [Clostridiales bacterium]